MQIRSRRRQAFSVWLRRNKGSSSFTVRFNVGDGIGALRIDQMGAVTPTLRRSQLGGLSADHLRKGRFMHFAASGEPKEYTLWLARADPDTLPVEQWVSMDVIGDGLVPKGWAPAGVLQEADEELTDLSFARGRLDLAMQVIKQRRSRRSEREAGAGGVPVGLVRHLRRTIARQEQEISALKAQLEMVRRGEKAT